MKKKNGFGILRGKGLGPFTEEDELKGQLDELEIEEENSNSTKEKTKSKNC